MSSNQDKPVDIQREIAADSRDHRRLMLEEWRLNVQTSLDAALDFQKLAAEYAQIALKSAFLVNAGALVALPPLMQWLSVAQRKLIPISAWPFIVGLMLAAVCAIVAYVNFMLISSVDSSRASVSAIQLAVNYGLRNRDELDGVEYKKNLRVEPRLKPWIIVTMILALLAGIFSYIAFFIGVFEFRQIVT